MSTQHTPGPWKLIWSQAGGIVTAKDGIYDIAVIRNFGRENNEANARLIAAAPELLDALQFAMLERACNAGDAILSGDEWRVFSIKARSAIAKAKGGEP